MSKFLKRLLGTKAPGPSGLAATFGAGTGSTVVAGYHSYAGRFQVDARWWPLTAKHGEGPPAYHYGGLCRLLLGAIPFPAVAIRCHMTKYGQRLVTANVWARRFAIRELRCNYRSLREMPSFRIIAFRVVRCSPRRVAAVVTTPPLS